MAEIQNNVLIVDDELELCEFHKILLEEHGFHVLTAHNGKQGLNMALEHAGELDIVLSDILMPEMDGYQLCQHIRENEKTKDIPLIFISTLETLEEKIKGYSFGADDYIHKPLVTEELIFKIKQLIARRKKNRDLDKQVMESQKATMQIMNFYGDLGQILEFYKNSTGAQNYQDLAGMLFTLTGDTYNLNCTLQVHTPARVLNFSKDGEISPLESNVIEMARKRDRFLTMGARLFISYDTFTLFIKNMPVEDQDRCGTLRDSLGVLCNAIEAKIKVFMNNEIDAHKLQITETVCEVLNHTRKTFKEIETANVSAIKMMMQDVEESFISLGLTDQQEQHITEILEECLKKTNKSFEKSKEVTALFDEIDQHLKEIKNIKKLH